MRTLYRHAILVIALLLASSPALLAQTASVAGTFHLDLNPAFSAMFASQGINLTSRGKALTNNRVVGSIAVGTLDLATGVGDFNSTASLEFSNSQDTVRILDLAFDTSGAFPVVTGAYYINGYGIGRFPVFDGDKGVAYSLPLTPGPDTLKNVNTSPSHFFRALLSGIYKTSAIYNYTTGFATPGAALTLTPNQS